MAYVPHSFKNRFQSAATDSSQSIDVIASASSLHHRRQTHETQLKTIESSSCRIETKRKISKQTILQAPPVALGHTESDKIIDYFYTIVPSSPSFSDFFFFRFFSRRDSHRAHFNFHSSVVPQHIDGNGYNGRTHTTIAARPNNDNRFFVLF